MVFQDQGHRDFSINLKHLVETKNKYSACVAMNTIIIVCNKETPRDHDPTNPGERQPLPQGANSLSNPVVLRLIAVHTSKNSWSRTQICHPQF